MLTSLCISGLGVGDDPSGFDVGEDNWAWSPPSREISSQQRVNGAAAPSSLAATTAAEKDRSLSSRLSTYFSRERAVTEGGGGVTGEAVGRGVGLRAPRYLQGRGARPGLGRGGSSERRDSPWVMALEALANELDASTQGIGNVGFGRGGGFTSVRRVSSDGIASLNLPSIQTLQCALRRGKHVPRRNGAGGESKQDGADLNIHNNGGRRQQGWAMRGRSYSGYGGARRDPPPEGRTDFAPVGYEAAVLWRLFCLVRGITALRVHGDLGGSTFTPERRIELQTFPALQDLRLKGVPLEHVQGLFTLRLQLKSLRFENAPLVSLLALLAPHATAEDIATTGTAGGPDAIGLPSGLPQRVTLHPRATGKGKLREANNSIGPNDFNVDDEGIEGFASSVEDVVLAANVRQTAAVEARGLPVLSSPSSPSSSVAADYVYDIEEVEGDWMKASPEVPASNLYRTRSSSFELSLQQQHFSPSTEKWKPYSPIIAKSRSPSSTAILARSQQDTAKIGRVGGATAFDVMGDGEEERGRAATSVVPGRQHKGLAGLRSQLGTGTPELRWSLLEMLSICRCGLRELDPSLRLLPRVRRLSLAHNRLSSVDFLQDCASLEELDLSFNRLESVEHIYRVLGNLRSLNLRGNRVTRTSGLDRTFSLEEIDLSHNAIRGLEDAARLSSLPLLRKVFLQGNPLEAEERKNYRVSVLSLLYKGRGGELERAAVLANVGGIGNSLGDFGVGDGGNVDVFRDGGIALDGVLPSRKELGELIRLRFASAVEVSPLPYFQPTSPVETPQTSTTSTDIGFFTPALSPLHKNTSPRATTATGRRLHRRRPRSVIGGRLMRSEEHERSTDLTLAVAAGPGASSPRASTIALDNDRSTIGAVADSGGGRGSSCLDVMDTTERSSGGYGFLDGIYRRKIGEDAEVLSAAGMGEERGVALRYEQGTSGEIRRCQHDPVVGVVHGDYLPRSMSSSDHAAGSTTRGGWTQPPPSASHRKSTGAVRRSCVGRRRGTRAVIIEEPEGGGGESDSPSGAILPQGFVSFCTVPLPMEHRPSWEDPSADDAHQVICRMKDTRAAQNPETVPEADHQSSLTPIKDTGDCFHALGRHLSLDSQPDSQWEHSSAVPVGLKKSLSPEKPSRLGDSTGEFLTPSPPNQTATAAIVGSSEVSQHQELPSIQRICRSNSVSGGVSTDVSSESVTVSESKCAISQGSATAAIGSLVASGDERKAPAEVSNCEEGEDDAGRETHVVAAATPKGERGSVRILTEESTEVSPLWPPSTVFCKETLHDLSPDEHGDTLPPTVSPDSFADANAFPSVSGIHGEVFREHGDAVSGSDGEDTGRARRLNVPTSGDTTCDLEGQGREQAEGSSHEHEDDTKEKESAAGAMHALGGNSTNEVEIQSVGKTRGQAMGEGGVDNVTVIEDDDYRGDAAYAGLLIAEHLELYFRQQVFNGVPCLSYSELQTGNLPRTRPHKVVAVVRETALPCLSHRPRTHHTSLLPHAGTSVSGNVVATGLDAGLALDAWDRRSATELATAGMARTVHQRGLEGEATGLMMGEVACVVVATEESVFLVDGTFAGKESLFSEAPRPRVLVVIPLASLERTTIGFRLQKLELHFDVHATGEFKDNMHAATQHRGSRSARDVDGKAPILAAGIGNENLAERVSVVLLTRDRARTFNLLQTLEPLATKARRALGLPATIVENRDEATLEAIAKALPNAFTPTSAFASRLATHGPASPDRPKSPGLFGRLGNWVGEIGTTGSSRDNQGGFSRKETDDDEATLDVDRGKEVILRQTPENATPSAGNGAPPSSPALSASTVTNGENMWSTEGRRGESDAGVSSNGVGGSEDGDGSLVVFQLLMQRWELRPWVVVPRTLVATKQKLALMDEDHTRMQAPTESSWRSTKTMLASNPSTPSCGGSVVNGGVREKRWSSTAGFENDGKGRRDSGVKSGVTKEVGMGEMTCIDVVDLGDVVRVHQEESAPEQVMIDFKGERAFDPRGQWRLQCRTRGSAEIVASAVHRLSLDRANQRKRGSWWNR